jgi:sulfatase maturation enzyme AslB (radical SAM superfamily)
MERSIIVPQQVFIEPTNACNARCANCIRKFSVRSNTYMELGLVDKILKEVPLFRLKTNVTLCGIGEPLLHPQFAEIAAMCRHHPWALSTNCQMLDNRMDNIIDNQPKEVVLSIDAATAQTHAAIRCGLDFSRVIRNVREFLRALKGRKVFWDNVFLLFIVSHQNYQEIDQFIDYWMPHIEYLKNVRIILKPICPWPNHTANTLYGKKLPHMSYQDNEHLVVGRINDIVKFAPTCILMDSLILILSDGSISLCCLNSDDVFHIGNAKDDTLLNLFNNDVANKYRIAIREKRYCEVPMCDTCI